ncbi:Cytosine deaminase [Friedmanniomyces endolithicus]|nr:Cytosine deaminase [Friedmanniomyces endolithicus]KAK0806020.1 Cytosine deaminase [Friedmanniomyces endolithicus]KAK0816215.1 Cytosine deaminase [Friedmanniomyces endolithicus]KAK0818974.1 Cytosine deaminase [Friedmanniomyces endolithicus]KAK0851323.1 Cytosine deaminase [Friedmanniomyces endolithicus]
MSSDDAGFKVALEEAKQGAKEGGIPIGACLVNKDGKILGRGHNMRLQKNSATLHAEISTLENAGRLPASAYQGATMYTTLSPCNMCTGACILYKVSRVVMGENKTLVGGEDFLTQRGIEVVNLKNAECEGLMKKFISEHPDDWYEDIGEPPKGR